MGSDQSHPFRMGLLILARSGYEAGEEHAGTTITMFILDTNRNHEVRLYAKDYYH